MTEGSKYRIKESVFFHVKLQMDVKKWDVFSHENVTDGVAMNFIKINIESEQKLPFQQCPDRPL